MFWIGCPKLGLAMGVEKTGRRYRSALRKLSPDPEVAHVYGGELRPDEFYALVRKGAIADVLTIMLQRERLRLGQCNPIFCCVQLSAEMRRDFNIQQCRAEELERYRASIKRSEGAVAAYGQW